MGSIGPEPTALNGSGDLTGRKDNTALPAIWYRSPALYELERRAIFSKQWLLMTHKNRLLKTGDYLRYEVAGFSFFLIKGRDGQIRGFHNVCRHRAYPVLRPEAESSGTKHILACYYHGWSYGLDGKLAKAPGVQDRVETFEKEKNGLFPIHVHIDQRGFIWVNLENSETPSVSWESMFQGSDMRPRLEPFNMDEYVFDHAWSMEGEYNWKACADNYNECYHCPTTHPGFAASCDLSKYSAEIAGGEILFFLTDKPGKSTNNYAPSYFYPNATISMTAPFWYMLKMNPKSATRVSLEYEVFRHKDATDAAFTEGYDFFKQVEIEDKELCNAAQKNLNTGIYAAGELEPHQEVGVLYAQKLIREAVMGHRKLEQQNGGHEIWPARLSKSQAGDNEDMEFCEELERCAIGTKEVEW
ncbi:hypothetical protein H2200_000290 [Cladophialophora chaetospira]|uniref:Choline monooxygenase, chloroplastic n=1 Tax=Cladophialophora chaetospira TaxID=386627 RepID=A0AA39CQU1_9EURO|nr:hypothetical protein H2200_000290 [Cladophialophora chaetospira]